MYFKINLKENTKKPLLFFHAIWLLSDGLIYEANKIFPLKHKAHESKMCNTQLNRMAPLVLTVWFSTVLNNNRYWAVHKFQEIYVPFILQRYSSCSVN